MKDAATIIENHREKIVQTVCDLIRIKSVKSAEMPGKPFGEGVNQALEYMLEESENIGFKTENVDGYAGHVDYGDGEETLGILVHLDVVPEGEDWIYPPFGGEIHEDKIYGRGAIDNKGPAVASLYALKAIKEMGIETKRKIRIIFGTDEESGWKDLEYYFQHYPKPDLGFSPDASFPVIHGEKGIQIFNLLYTMQQDEQPIQLVRIKGGNAANMVADRCEVELSMAENIKQMLGNDLEEFIKKTGYDLELEPAGENMVIKAKGISAHGSRPEKGKNAISHLLLFLAQCPGLNESLKKFAAFYEEKIGTEVNGQSIGCGFEDDLSGKLAFNVGKIEMNQDQLILSINTRSPITLKAECVFEGIRKELQETGIHLEIEENIEPLYVPVEDELVKQLMEVYRTETGDLESQPITIGGGTYARALPKAVAFGALFPGQEELAHQKNECIEIKDLMKMTLIYTKAIEALVSGK
ncbi:succinyl-diaminopimelate desuccinylase [Tindallia magadiensis]|uniref:Succinyl-diaminopimelate desuccinylase n=1 Tax=Tindallia magadiensis TaxID=69895 RepID=A0A1I3DWA8_9FIRM|nr:dipeptidase PepV [Tindallia magadiensis]SFH90879.1 succinyl-diaminopimelate desuccinylase [Tindallia magadiensis]